MSRIPATPATRLLTSRRIAYECHLYRYEEHGGTRVSARELGVDEHAVVKTICRASTSTAVTAASS